MKKNWILLITAAAITGCSPSGTKEKINKGGEVVGEAVGEFMSGVGSGVEQAFDPKVELAETLKAKGLQVGEMQLEDNTGTDDVLSVYLIFEKDFKDIITVKAFNEHNKEMGRVRDTITGRKGDAYFHDFVFDKRTNIDNNSKLVIE